MGLRCEGEVRGSGVGKPAGLFFVCIVKDKLCPCLSHLGPVILPGTLGGLGGLGAYSCHLERMDPGQSVFVVLGTL